MYTKNTIKMVINTLNKTGVKLIKTLNSKVVNENISQGRQSLLRRVQKLSRAKIQLGQVRASLRLVG